MPHVLGDDLEKCRARFPGDTPFGTDIKYDPLFEGIKAEVLKLTAHTSLEGGVDWKMVKARSLEILGTKSKDLTVACYLTTALFMLDGYGGLADGIEILHAYVKDDWEGVFPPAARPRNRALTLEWLVTRLAPFVENKAPEPFEIALLPPLRDQLAAFQEGVRQRLLHEAPSFTDLNAAIAVYLEDLKDAPVGGNGSAPAPTAEAPSASPQGTAPPVAAQPAPVAVAAGTPADEIAGRIRALVPALRDADSLSPMPYRLLRTLKWESATEPPLDPNSPNPGTTRIQPPRAQQRLALENMLAASNWAALLTTSEGAFQDAGGTFWLDLHRYTATALEGLGATRAADAVKEEVARVVGRLKTLTTLAFADRTVIDPRRPTERTIERTPFASEETRQWIETLKSDAAGEAAPALALPTSRAVEPSEPALSPTDARTIQEMLNRQQSTAAFDLLQAAVDKAPNQRARFRTRLTAARLCLQANQTAWARALLETLLTETETFRFEDWEPETAADLYQLLALCYARPARKGGPQDPEAARVQIEDLRKKLFRIDMRAAAGLEEALRR
jgi:type VI secretion system protein VasJ